MMTGHGDKIPDMMNPILPEKRTKEEHLALVTMLKGKVMLAWVKRQYTLSFKKDELETLKTVLLIAEAAIQESSDT